MLVLPRAPDLDMNTAMETSMWVRARPGGGERQSLLGTYPVPAPQMVGAPLPPTPGCPSRWEPPLPPLQYGIDYTFLRHDDSQPLRWRPDLPITVRIAGPHEPEQAATVDAVVAELAGLTGLSLAVGESWPHPLALRAVSAQEIRVGFLATLPPARSFRPCAGRVGLGGAVGAPGLSYYTSGFALVATGITGPHRPSVVAVLRHELAHALGLGHAARPDLLMYHRISDAIADFGRGDRRGLFLLNEGAQPEAG